MPVLYIPTYQTKVGKSFLSQVSDAEKLGQPPIISQRYSLKNFLLGRNALAFKTNIWELLSSNRAYFKRCHFVLTAKLYNATPLDVEHRHLSTMFACVSNIF